MGKRRPTALAGHSATLTPQRATYATSALFLRIHRQFSALRYRRGYTPRPIGISRDFMRIRAGADARSDVSERAATLRAGRDLGRTLAALWVVHERPPGLEVVFGTGSVPALL